MPLQRPHVPIALAFLVLLIAVVNGFAYEYHWYWLMRWFDIPMHIAGGIWLGGMGIWWKYSYRKLAPHGFLPILAVSIIFAVGFGLLWEGYEALVRYVMLQPANSLFEDIKDVLFDILGGLIVGVLAWWRMK